jgi:methionyl-tRNA formyltransferase|tara:strand:- start:581 stop:1528 length:948 start_codon:yes stop_codon:yes gene_type:complete
MKKANIVFMGTPDFAVTTLKTLVDNNYNIVGVITAPDRPAGRGQKLNESAVKKYAANQNLKILQPTNLKDETFLNELKALNANLQIVVAFRMLPKQVWKMPEYGTFNLHASLLPNYRGAAPINWALINGETKTGITTFFIDDKIDTGEIIMQKELNITPNENAGSLHDRLMIEGSELVLKTVKAIEENTVKTKVQTEINDIKTAYKIHKHTCKIDWNDSIDVIHNKIRGLSPYPAAWTELSKDDSILAVKIFEVTKYKEKHNFNNGEIISDKESVKVAVNGGFLEIHILQLPGKKKMDVKSLLNGFSFGTNSKML